MEQKTVLQAKGICKQFNGIPVLKSVDLSIKSGEVHALIGENGAGKSTIIKIITGVYSKDAGEIIIEDEPVLIHTRKDAINCGISVIYQELSLIPALTVAENIFLGHEITRYGTLCQRKMNIEVGRLIEKYGFDIKPGVRVERLSMAKRQLVEILKALSADAKVIIMDEPTSALSATETEILFNTIDALKKKGTAILYVSHRLDEIYRIADRVTVMRDGVNEGVLEKNEINAGVVVKMMIGHEVLQDESYLSPAIDEGMCLEVKNLAYKNVLKDVSFRAYGGEILGISGLAGSGRTELIKCIYGLYRQSGGELLLNGKPVSKSVKKNIHIGFGFVPEDRLIEGFAPVLSVAKNLLIASYDIYSRLSVVLRRKENACAEQMIKDFDIRPKLKHLPVSNLSGGNQQKVVLGRWLSRKPKVLLLDEPTAGVDVGVKEELYGYVRALAGRGAIVIVVSSDLDEVRRLCDRVLVIYNGRMFEEFSHNNASQAAILTASSGVHTEEGRAL